MSVSLTDNNQYEDQHYDHHLYSTSNETCGISSSSSSGISEIEEEHEGSNGDVPNETKRFAPMPSIKEEHDKASVLSVVEDSVYVAVGKSSSSAQALDWALKNAINSSSTVVYLIHIYPEIKQIPTPLGKLPLSQVSPEQVKTYMAQERGKRRELLHKFLLKCSAAFVNVDTVLIESDGLPKAILDLVVILNIRKLVVGTTKSSLRKLRSRRGTGTADQILKGAPETCEVKIICEGNEVVVIDRAVESPSHRGGDADSSTEFDNSKSIPEDDEEDREKIYDKHKRSDAISCMCFKSKLG